MNKYIALLRGINVGGKNRVVMSQLKKELETIGFSEVVTYINSGNIVFSSTEEDKETIRAMFEKVIVDEFQLHIPVAILLAEELDQVVTEAPAWWNKNKDDINYVIFVLVPYSTEDIVTIVGEIKPEYEKIAFHRNAIYWTTQRDTFSKTRWSKIAATTANQMVTIRNANTVHKLNELSK